MPWFTGTLYLVEYVIIFANVNTKRLEFLEGLAFLAENVMSTGT